MKKLVFALIIVAALLVVAMPVMAQGPVMLATTDQGLKPVWVVQAGTNEDPFGGLPIQTSSGLGSASKYGVGGPGVFLRQGGKPSALSGDGTTPRKSVYIGGAWSGTSDLKELPTCVTLKVPAGSSRWVKADTWKNYRIQLWVDDELNGAKAPTGSARFGAADGYTYGLAPDSAWLKNAYDVPGRQTNPKAGTGPWHEGLVLAVYSQDAMMPNYMYPAPNGALYTLNTGASGGLLRGPQMVTLKDMVGKTVEGYAEYNKNQPSHLIWYEGRFDGWVHGRIYNQMIWDADASICSYRSWPY